MEKFIHQFKEHISGVLRGIDRIMIKGYITDFYHNNNFYYFLSEEQVQLKDYKEYVLKITSKIAKLRAHKLITKIQNTARSAPFLSGKTVVTLSLP